MKSGIENIRASKPLNIWILEIGEPLPIEPGVRLHRYGQFSKWLAAQGHSVIWWTSSFSHAAKKNFVDRDCELLHDGVRLKFIYSKGYQRNISLARIRHQAEFGKKFLLQAEALLAAAALGLRGASAASGLPDVILAPIPTIDGAAAAVEFGRKHGIPVIADIRDLWPDEIRDLAPKFARGLAELVLFRAYKKLRFVCSKATAICGVSRSYLDYGLSFSGRRRSTDLNLALDFVFPLGYSVQKISDEKLATAEEWYAALGVPAQAFVSCFFGTIGKFFDLATVVRAARELDEDYYFILAGNGSSLPCFKNQARDLKNVIFTGWLEAAQIQIVMKHSHVGLAPYAAHAKMSLPNKPFEYMSAGLPVVSSIRYELKDILAANNAGFSYHAESSAELVGLIRKLAKEPKLCAELGRNAHALFEREFSSEKVFVMALTNIQKVVEVVHAKGSN